MSAFVKHKPCPECGSRDNLAEFDDGHHWCFGCNHYIPPEHVSEAHIEAALRKVEGQKEEENSDTVALPLDYSRSLPPIARMYLQKYGITQDEIEHNSFGWSRFHERLIYPVFDSYGNLLMYQGRYLGDKKDKPRFSTKGKPEDIFHILGPSEKRIIVVEDLLSAIIVGRQACVMPLWGSSISDTRIRRLASSFHQLCIWLDADKHRSAVKYCALASQYFPSVRVLYTIYDPKEYDDLEIAVHLEKS